VTKAYDFTKSGTGEYSVEPRNLFTAVDAGGTPKDVYATVGKTAKVKLSGDLPAPHVHDKRATFDSCSSEEQSQLRTAAKNAQTYASRVYNYITDIPGETIRYSTWFGEYDEDRKTTVEEHFHSINSNDFSEFAYDCTCTDPDTFAYVCAYNSRAWACYLAVDKCPNQIPMILEPSTFVAPSGKPLPSVPIPRPGRLSTRLPTSPSMVVPKTMLTVRKTARTWL